MQYQYNYNTSSPGQEQKKIGQHLSPDYWHPGHENPAMGFFWGADQDYRWWAQKKLFLMLFLLKNLEIIVWRSCLPSQLIGRGRVSREGALDHRESQERREKIFAAKTENAKIFKRILDQENSFQWEIFIFWPRKN